MVVGLKGVGLGFKNRDYDVGFRGSSLGFRVIGWVFQEFRIRGSGGVGVSGLSLLGGI